MGQWRLNKARWTLSRITKPASSKGRHSPEIPDSCYRTPSIISPPFKVNPESISTWNLQITILTLYHAAAAKSLQSCLTLCDPIDGSPPGSAVPGILQARTLEWIAIPFSSVCKWKVKVKSLSHVRLFATPWTAANQAPRSMGFSRQEYWSGVPLPSPTW